MGIAILQDASRLCLPRCANTGAGTYPATIKTPKNSVVFLAPANNTSFITIDGNAVRVDDGSTAPLEVQSAVFVTGDFSAMAI